MVEDRLCELVEPETRVRQTGEEIGLALEDISAPGLVYEPACDKVRGDEAAGPEFAGKLCKEKQAALLNTVAEMPVVPGGREGRVWVVGQGEGERFDEGGVGGWRVEVGYCC